MRETDFDKRLEPLQNTMSDLMTKTTILIETNTRAELKKLGTKDETYDTINMKLIGYYKDRTGKHENTPFTYNPETKRK